MVRFIHTADIHLGIENYGHIDAHTGVHTRLLDFNVALNFCIDTAIAEHVDFFLFCGDAYKTAYPTPTHQKFLFQAFMRLYHAHIPVVIVVGNHDHPVSFGRAHALDVFAALPVDGFYVISQPKILQLITVHGPVNIIGLPWPTRSNLALNAQVLCATAGVQDYISQAVGNIVRDFARELDKEIPAILAGHVSVSEAIFSGSEKRALSGSDVILLPSQLACEPFDYCALGHIHRYQQISSSAIPMVYAGSLERIDFSERDEEKGFCLVSLEKKGNVQIQRIVTPTRPFAQIDVTLRADEDQTQQIIRRIEAHKITGAIVKIVYHVPHNEQDAVNSTLVHQACANAHHIVGIIPIRPTPMRERRTSVHLEMSSDALVRAYFDQKPELQKDAQRLTEKTLELLHVSEERERTPEKSTDST